MESGDDGFPRHAKQAGASHSGTGSSCAADKDSEVNKSATTVPKIEVAASADEPKSTTTPMQLHDGQQCLVPRGVVREQEQYVPIANVIRIMRRVLPAYAKISDDAKETVQECVSEYISFITGEANDRCKREQRKTITAEDVLWAMGQLGFDDYIQPLSLYLNRYRQMENERTSICDPILQRGAAYKLPLLMGDHPAGTFDPTILGGYYRDASGAVGGSSSSSRNSLANFDPYPQFK